MHNTKDSGYLPTKNLRDSSYFALRLTIQNSRKRISVRGDPLLCS